MYEIPFRSAKQLASLIRRKKVGCLELLDMYLKRIERHNSKINAIIFMNVDGARKRAKAADRTSVIVMQVDAHEGWTTEGHTWWEVGTPHVSEHEKVRAAHQEIESKRTRQRKGV